MCYYQVLAQYNIIGIFSTQNCRPVLLVAYSAPMFAKILTLRLKYEWFFTATYSNAHHDS